MKSLKEQTDAQIEQTRKAKPEFMAKIDAAIDSARKFEEGGNALEAGQSAPNFSLPDAGGQETVLSALLEKGPAVIVFYRGSWCPYCNFQLRALQTKLPEIHAQGAELIAISPQVPDESLSQVERDALDFLVLSDQNAATAASYGVAWEVPELILEHMRKDRKLDLADINNGNGSSLPIPATFIVDTNGVIAWSHVDVDYRTRPEPSDVVAALQSLNTQS